MWSIILLNVCTKDFALHIFGGSGLVLKCLVFFFFVEFLFAWQYLSICVKSVLTFTIKDCFAQNERSTFDVPLQNSHLVLFKALFKFFIHLVSLNDGLIL